jgi:putative membrane protein
MKLASHRNLILVLVILHLVGVVGILIPQTRNLVLPLSAINLFLGFIVILLSDRKNITGLLVFSLIAFLIGYGSELIGVHTGALFGNYWYGANLGLKLMEVPLIIGINWGVLAITSASLTQRFIDNIFIKIGVNSLLMVFFDFVMEPVAMKSDFWSWENDVIPFFNYVCWFFVATILQVIYLNFFRTSTNKVLNTLFIIQLLFFIILNFF